MMPPEVKGRNQACSEPFYVLKELQVDKFEE